MFRFGLGLIDAGSHNILMLWSISPQGGTGEGRGRIASLGPRWLKTISKFGSELRRIAPQRRLHGISINFERRGGDRVVTLKLEGAATGMRSTNKPKA